MKKVIIYTIVCLAVLGVTVFLYVNYKPHKKIEHEKGISVSASDISKTYVADETRANAAYLSKVVSVTGAVAEVDKNQDGGLTVVLETGDPANGVQCAMRDKGISVAKGQKVAIKGRCSGSGIMGVTLTDCIMDSQ